MNNVTPHTDPDTVAEAMDRMLEAGAIQPFRMYTAEEAGNVLRFSKWQSIYEIPENELPKRRIGPARRSIRYFGADILAYMAGVDPIDVAALLDQLRSRISAPSPVRPLPSSNGHTRLM